MRSLFAKILLWFLFTVGVSLVGFVLITAANFAAADRRPVFGRLSRFALEEARHAYEAGGRQALGELIGRLQSTMDAEAALTDARGIDLLTGEDRSLLLERAPRPRRIPLRLRNRAVLARKSADQRYSFLLIFTPEEEVGSWFLQPQYFWLLGATILLCWALALHLTAPVRRMQAAVERFGTGDFTARVNSRRQDELGRLARTLDEMAGRIETLLAAERRLLLDVSHELRSPLARLGVAVELARSGPNREAALDRIEKESERLNALVGELLQVTRAEADPAARRSEPVALGPLLSELVDDGQIEAPARGCSLSITQLEPLTVSGDRELLRRAIENIVRNAVRYAPAGTTVDISLEQRGNSAVVQVRDYGPGVPETSLPLLFNAFYRVESDRARASGGVGLGLAIAKRALELHHGTLSARNANPGLLVELSLPTQPAIAFAQRLP